MLMKIDKIAFRINGNHGIFYTVVACFLFAIMGATVKYLSRDFSPVQIVFFRNVVGVGFLSFTLIRRPFINQGRRPWLLLFRGVAGTLSLYALFYNMSAIGLGISMTYLQTSPIFVAIFSMLFLKERLSIYGWLAIFIGFAGIVLVFRPNPSMSIESGIIGIFNGIVAAAAYTSVRELKKYYDTRVIVFSFMIIGIILPLVSMITGEIKGTDNLEYIVSEFIMPHGMQWVWILVVGLSAMTGQVFITMAYGEEKAGIISAVGYLLIPFSMIIGTIMGDSIPDLLAWMGIFMIISGGVIISVRRNI